MRNLDRDSIDFEKMSISRLFIKLFIPTLLGMVFNSAFNIIDGIIVGRGVGSDALAAVNVAAPIYLIATAFGLMFASGASIVAAVHLSQNNNKAANIITTQAFFAPLVVLLPLSLIILFFAEPLGYMFGGSDLLSPLIVEYMTWISPIPILTLFNMVGIFIIRLDGSPKYAMYLSVISATLNSVLDYLFIFPWDFGLKGAAIATSISMTVEAVMVFVYMIFFSKQIKFYNVKRTKTSLYLTWRNVKYMANLGMSSFIGEAAILFMMIVGNNMFMHFLQEDGVAAFSVCCYLFPLVFMFGNAIAQSQMPIISYNYGLKDWKRINYTFRLGVIWSIVCGLLLTTWGLFFNEPVVALFLDTSSSAYEIATEGLPYFSISFLFITLNLVYITYFQSIEQARFANFFMLLRGIFFLIPIFIFIPLYLGEIGLWLSVPLSEIITFLAIAIARALKSKKEGEQQKTNVL